MRQMKVKNVEFKEKPGDEPRNSPQKKAQESERRKRKEGKEVKRENVESRK